MAERIVIAEDDEDLAFVLREALIRNQYEVEIAPTAGALLDRLRAGAYDLVLLDVKLPDMDGLDALPKCRELAPETPIIVMTAHGTRQIAMEAITRGAYDFFTKPLKMAEFQVVVARALDRRRLQQQVKVLRAGQPTGFEEIIGQCEPLKRVLDMAQRAAPTDLTILIQGRAARARRCSRKPSTGSASERTGRSSPSTPRPFRKGSSSPSCSATSAAPSRGDPGAARPLRAGPRGHALSRRDRRHAAVHAGQDPARPAGAADRARGRRQVHRRRRADRRRHAPEPRDDGHRGPVPPGPLLSAPGRDAAPAAAPGAASTTCRRSSGTCSSGRRSGCGARPRR